MDGHAGLLIAGRRPPAGRAVPGLGALAASAAAAAALVDPWWALWAKSLADPFVHATSAGAAVTALGFLALALLAAQAGPVLTRRQTGLAAAVLLAALLLGHAANLAAQVIVSWRQDLPLTVAAYHWDGPVNTYSFVLHSHTGKVAVDWLLGQALGWLAPGFDIGRGMAASLPGWTAPVVAAALLVSTVAALALVRAMASGPQPLARSALFGWCAWVCVKAIADGGPLTYRVAPCGAALLVLLARSLGASRRTQGAIAAVAAVVAVLGLSLWLFTVEGAGGEALADLAVTLALLVALALRVAGWPGLHWRLLTLACAGVVCLAMLGSVVRGPLALAQPLAPGSIVLRCDLASQRCDESPASGRAAFDVYLAAGDDPLKPQHTIIASAATAGARHAITLPVVVHPVRSAQPSAASPTGAVTAVPLHALGEQGNVLVLLQADALPELLGATPTPWTQRNYHVFLHLGAAALRAQGLDRFALVPLLRPSDAASFGLSAVQPPL